MEERIIKIEQELQAIAERNLRVEADKAWETSFFRKLVLAVITYIVALFLLYVIGADHIFLSALVPSVGFILSVQTLPAVKRLWVGKFFKK
ncbi:MAG: hypothetical protein Q7R64_02700 [bacterium]|nr:hypothetical protein [bacterium]